MQTYTLFTSHVKTARVLDNVRLGRQRLDVLSILEAILTDDTPYRGHPAVMSWRSHPEALVWYGFLICHEWRIERGHKDDTWGTLAKYAAEFAMTGVPKSPDKPIKKFDHPPWIEDKDVLRSHRSNLVRVAPRLYEAEFPGTPANMPYLWPQATHRGEVRLRLSAPDIERLEKGERELPPWLRWDEHKREVVRDDG